MRDDADFHTSTCAVVHGSARGLFSVVEKTPFHPAARAERRTITVGSRARTSTLYGQGRPYHAALIVLHGARGSGEGVRRQSGHAFDRLADSEPCLVVYPDGFQGHWNDGRRHARFATAREGIDDIGFLRALIASLCSEFALQSSSIYLVGFSNGGHLVYRALAAMPESLAGAVIIGANRSVPGHAVFALDRLHHPVLLVAGDRDPINPYHGGRTTLFGLGYRGNVLSAEDSAAELARLASSGHPSGCASGRMTPSRNHDGMTSTIDYSREGSVQVRLLRLHGAGHTIPQSYAEMPRMLGDTASGIDIARYAWQFFHLDSHARMIRRSA
jgi:polyhydroxybutyrate depolymerase